MLEYLDRFTDAVKRKLISRRLRSEIMGWVCFQLGAREHFAIPSYLLRQGIVDANGRLGNDKWGLLGAPVVVGISAPESSHSHWQGTR